MKYFFIGGVALFATVGMVGYFRRPPQKIVEIRQEAELKTVVQEVPIPLVKAAPRNVEPLAPNPPVSFPQQQESVPALAATGLPDADRVRQLFATDSSRLPIVETISYTSRAPWIQGRPAWIADYASHYSTSRHFIARSLNKKADYLTQKVSPGDRFNVFKKDKNIQFYLLADLSRCRMWFYYIDLDLNERVLLKTYSIGVGRIDQKRKSGYLTPCGKYSFGEKIAIYKPGTTGFFHDEQIEMVRVFGTRWIPFDQELDGCTESSKGLGLHGAPWIEDVGTHQGAPGDPSSLGIKWTEDRSKIGKYDSDGCIRLLADDIEEIFSIVITKPTTIELVKDFREAKLPGIEKNP